MLIVVGYWPSYNVPFYPVIYNMSGYDYMTDIYGTLLSYELAPRAKIFRRDQGTVVDMKTMQAIMRYNGMYLGQVNCVTCLTYLWFSSWFILRHVVHIFTLSGRKITHI